MDKTGSRWLGVHPGGWLYAAVLAQFQIAFFIAAGDFSSETMMGFLFSLILVIAGPVVAVKLASARLPKLPSPQWVLAGVLTAAQVPLLMQTGVEMPVFFPDRVAQEEAVPPEEAPIVPEEALVGLSPELTRNLLLRQKLVSELHRLHYFDPARIEDMGALAERMRLTDALTEISRRCAEELEQAAWAHQLATEAERYEVMGYLLKLLGEHWGRWEVDRRSGDVAFEDPDAQMIYWRLASELAKPTGPVQSSKLPTRAYTQIVGL